MNERAAFGFELRRIRERRGLTLEQMSAQTKVSVAHYAALEAGDLSRWPSGIFRRAFVRSYAVAVGLDPAQLLAEFGRIFPDPADGPKAAARIEAARREEQALAAAHDTAEPKEDFSAFRLALEPPRPEEGLDRLRIAWPRVEAAVADVCLALGPAAVAWLVLGRAWFLPTAAGIAFFGHVLYYSLTGATPGRRVVASLSRQLASQLPRAAASRPPEGGDQAPRRRRFSRHSANRPASHPHRVQH